MLGKYVVETPLVTIAEVGGSQNSPFVSVQAYSLSPQVKAAAAQVGGRNWNWRKKILCPTIEVFTEKETTKEDEEGMVVAKLQESHTTFAANVDLEVLSTMT